MYLWIGSVTGSPFKVNSPNSLQSGSTPNPDFFNGVGFLQNNLKLILDQYANKDDRIVGKTSRKKFKKWLAIRFLLY